MTLSQTNSQTLTLLAVAAVAIVVIAVTNVQIERVQETRPIPPPQNLEHFTFGYNDNVADSLWIRLIQDIDHCDTANILLKSKKCENVQFGWSYQMLDAITTITPKFRMPYNHGATILSVTVQDTAGAKAIFDRGVENFPSDWSLLYRAAYHYLYELHDESRAADLLTLAGKNGAPEWVYSLAAKLYTKEGKAFLAKSVLQSVLEEEPDSQYSEAIRKRLSEVDAELKAAEKVSAAAPPAPSSGKKSKRSAKKAE